MDNLNINQIRDELIAKQVKYKQDLELAEISLKNITEIREKISDDDFINLQKMGFDISLLQTLDVSKLKNDDEYLNNVKNNIDNMIEAIYKELLEVIK